MKTKACTIAMKHDQHWNCKSTASAAGQGLVNRGLKAADVLHRCALTIARLQVLVQDGDYLII